MATATIESGVVFGFGGTNARSGEWKKGDPEVTSIASEPTPSQPKEFFQWMARRVLKAADQGHGSAVAGFPGPVNGELVGPMVNVPGLSQSQYNLPAELKRADPAMRRLIEDDGFVLLPTNDGALAAHAVAARYGQGFNKVAALINGTGTGAGVVERDAHDPQLFRASPLPIEIGHGLLWGIDPTNTFENFISGPALEKRFGAPAHELGADHQAWEDVGNVLGRLTVDLGLQHGVELVVPTGGVGAGASDKYGPHFQNMLREYGEASNATQRLFLPEVALVPPSEAQTFELHGAAGVMSEYAAFAA